MADVNQRSGVMIVVSGPSGVGKSTLCQGLLTAGPNLRGCVTCTTRPPRAGEVDGRDYHFLSDEQFRQGLAAGRFLEHAEVHGRLYGTPLAEITQTLPQGRDLLLNIDVQGAAQVRASPLAKEWLPVTAFVFIIPPSLAELERRLRGRGTDSEAAIQRRLANAREELKRWQEYDCLVTNGVLAEALGQLHAVLEATRLRAVCWRGRPPWEN